MIKMLTERKQLQKQSQSKYQKQKSWCRCCVMKTLNRPVWNGCGFPYIPFGKLTIIQGNPGEGKTYFAMMLTAACTNRKLFPNMEDIEPFNVIYQTAEDGMGDTIKPRLVEAGADLSRVMVIDDTEEALTLSDDRIEKAVRQNHVRLVIIDPVQAFIGADVDMNRANEVRPVFPKTGNDCREDRMCHCADRTSE